MSLLSRDDIVRLLGEVAAELEGQGMQGRLFVVGGAAMALAYGRDRLTRDVDAVFEPKAVVYRAAQAVAVANGLPDDWLNDAVKGFLPGPDRNATTFFDEPGLTVQVASPRYMFVLKALAARVDRDAADLVALYRLSGFGSVDEALDAVDRAVPAQLIQPKTHFLLRELLSGISEDYG
jgi:hypothetical protein